MADIKIYQEYGEELERRVRLKTFPIALKMLEEEKDVPEGAKRPMKDLGHQYSLCQVLQMVRRNGTPMAFMEGHNRHPRDVKTLEAGRHYAEEFPKLKVGKYVGIAMAPLRATNFEPDAVMIYGDSSQLCLLMLARENKDGYNLKCALSSHAACVYGMVPALQTGECQVAVPCRGDHYRAMAGDDEMIFTVPRGKLDDLMEGLRYVEKTGSKLPQGYAVLPEHPVHESYRKIGEMMGYIKK